MTKSRIDLYGEVFTAPKQVEDMLNLVNEETLRIDSRFLEPACGDGNFLIKVLERKISLIQKKYLKSQIEFERYSVLALGSLYGVEILPDNLDECKVRLYDYFLEIYNRCFPKSQNEEFLGSIKFIIDRNILLGDALTMKTPDGKHSIIFSEWSFIKGSLLQRSDYTFSDLLAYKPEQNSLFSDLGEEVIIPPAVKVFKPIHYSKIQNAE
jgi:hypothetical protein